MAEIIRNESLKWIFYIVVVLCITYVFIKKDFEIEFEKNPKNKTINTCE